LWQNFELNRAVGYALLFCKLSSLAGLKRKKLSGYFYKVFLKKSAISCALNHI
jgi:hypothetical protein